MRNSLWWVFCMSHFLCELVEVVSCDIQLGSDIQLGTHAEGLAGLHLFNCPHEWSHLVGLYCCKYLPKSLPQQGIRCIIAKQLFTWFLERMKWSYVVLALTHRYVPMFPRMSWLFFFPAQTWQSHTVYPKKYAHGFVVLCFVVVMQSFIMNSHEVFIHIHQGCFAGTGAIVRLPQCQWSKPDGYGKISQCITTTKHSKAKTVCIFLGIYCNFAWLMILSWCCHKLIYVRAHWYAGLYEDNLRVRESTTHISSTHPEQQDYRSYWQQVEDSKIVVLRIIVVLIIAWSIDPYNAYPIAWKTTSVL